MPSLWGRVPSIARLMRPRLADFPVGVPYRNLASGASSVRQSRLDSLSVWYIAFRYYSRWEQPAVVWGLLPPEAKGFCKQTVVNIRIYVVSFFRLFCGGSKPPPYGDKHNKGYVMFFGEQAPYNRRLFPLCPQTP